LDEVTTVMMMTPYYYYYYVVNYCYLVSHWIMISSEDVVVILATGC